MKSNEELNTSFKDIIYRGMNTKPDDKSPVEYMQDNFNEYDNDNGFLAEQLSNEDYFLMINDIKKPNTLHIIAQSNDLFNKLFEISQQLSTVSPPLVSSHDLNSIVNVPYKQRCLKISLDINNLDALINIFDNDQALKATFQIIKEKLIQYQAKQNVEKMPSAIGQNILNALKSDDKGTAKQLISNLNTDSVKDLQLEEAKDILLKIIEKDDLALYKLFVKKYEANMNREVLVSLQEITQLLPEKSRIASYLVFNSFPSTEPLVMDNVISSSNDDSFREEIFNKIIDVNIHESLLGSTLLAHTIRNGATGTELNASLPAKLIALLDKGADPSLRDYYGQNAVHIAAQMNGDALLYLPPNASLANSQDLWGNTPLYYAVKNNDFKTVRFLLEKWQADPNVSNHTGKSPLMLAAELGNTEILTLLLKYNADPSAADKFGLRAIDWALGHQRDKIVSLLESQNSPSPLDKGEIDNILIKHSYVDTLSVVGNMGRDSNAILSSFKNKNNIYVIDTSIDLELILFLLRKEAENNPEKKITVVLQLNEIESTHFSVAQLELTGSQVNSFLVDTVSTGLGIEPYNSIFHKMFPDGTLIIDSTHPQYSTSTCRIFCEDIAEKMDRYGVDYSDLKQHIHKSINKNHYLNKNALPLVLGGRTAESVSQYKAIEDYRKSHNPNEILTNKKGQPISKITEVEVYGETKPFNEIVYKKLASYNKKLINKLSTMGTQEVKQSVLKSFGFFMLKPGVFKVSCETNENLLKLTVKGNNYLTVLDRVDEIIKQLNIKHPTDQIQISDLVVKTEGGPTRLYPEYTGSKEAFNRLIEACDELVQKDHIIDVKLRKARKLDSPLCFAALINDFKTAIRNSTPEISANQTKPT